VKKTGAENRNDGKEVPLTRADKNKRTKKQKNNQHKTTPSKQQQQPYYSQKVGREEPVASMDGGGKIVWARGCEVHGANVRALGGEAAAAAGDGGEFSGGVSRFVFSLRPSPFSPSRAPPSAHIVTLNATLCPTAATPKITPHPIRSNPTNTTPKKQPTKSKIKNQKERLPLASKELGSTDAYPQSLRHSPNGRFVACCGDGEYVVYTALAWRSKAFGPALEFGEREKQGERRRKKRKKKRGAFLLLVFRFRPPVAVAAVVLVWFVSSLCASFPALRLAQKQAPYLTRAYPHTHSHG